MKKILGTIGVLFGAVVMVGCNKVSGPDESSSVSKVSQKSSHVKSTVSSKASSKVSETDETNGQWSANQDKQLSDFMKNWQTSMGQSFKETYDGKSIDHLGFVYPDDIKNAPQTAYVYDQEEQLKWYQGQGSGRFVVYTAASGGKPEVTRMSLPMLYLFALDTKDNSPVVLVSQTTNGQYLWFYETENPQLRQGFSQILESVMTEDGSSINGFDREGETWTKADAIDYRRHMDSKIPSINAAVGTTNEGEGMYNLEDFTFTSHGRTCDLSSGENSMMWSFTKMSGGRTVVVLQFVGDEPMPAPEVVFYTNDSDRLVYEAYHSGEPLE
jgi:hypothetical protein